MPLPTSWNPAQPVSETNQPPNLKPGELEPLAVLATNLISTQQLEREVAFNGGAAPEGELTQKQRASASMTAGNIHNGSK